MSVTFIPNLRVREILTVSGVTGMKVGKTKMTETKAVHMHAQALTKTLSRPRCQGPRSNLPKNSLQRMGMQYDQSRAMAQVLKMAEIVT